MSNAGGILFIAGTGTDIGKTHIAQSLLYCAQRLGFSVDAHKPVVSGDDGQDPASDVARLSRACGGEFFPPLHRFLPPISPHLAAERAGVTLSMPKLAEHIRTLQRPNRWLLVESAGGLFSPLSLEHHNGDLWLALGRPPMVLVAPDRLGVLHDLSACLMALESLSKGPEGTTDEANAKTQAKPKPPLVVFSRPQAAPEDASFGSNPTEAERLGLGPIRALFGHGSPSSQDALAAAAELWRALPSEL